MTVVATEEAAKSWAKNAAVIIEGTAKDNFGVFDEEGGQCTGTDSRQCGARWDDWGWLMTEALLVYRVRTINPEDLHQKHNTVGPKNFIFHGIYFKFIQIFQIDALHGIIWQNRWQPPQWPRSSAWTSCRPSAGCPWGGSTSMILACRDSILLGGLCPPMVYKCLTFSRP